ncbi:unnamed protein product [Caenorhabditis auriculariae]|uniref:Tudor domain-containing protein n=1 Tax=Caenorhabditis auriculariae TaxID=2777116 RepID=A0A8S1HK45_9PELO|nr:unnamed protein product [Caenorhabditis auriculariae]
MDPHPVKTEAPSPISTPIQPLLNISMSGRGETRPFGSPPEEDIVSFARSLTNRKKLLKDCSSNQMMMINFSPDVFKVTTEFTGTEIVQLSPEVNIGRLKLEFKTLRTAVFSDFAWLADVRSKQYRLSDGFYLCSVLHPVAPAHVIMGAEVPANTQIMEQINDEIQKVPLLPLDVKKIVPGMECIYAYESAGFTYLRALILGGTSNGQGAKIILVDHHTFYALDAEFSSLRQMAPQFSLKRLKTRIFLGQIRGVDGVKRKLQDEVHEKILKERNQGEVVCAVFGTDKPNEVNLIDYVMMENGEDKDWISKYLLSSDSANPAPKHPDFLNLTLALQVCDRLPQPDRFSNPELGHFEEQGAHNQDQMEVFEHVPSPVEESQVEMRDAESSPERIEVAEVSQRETTSKNSELRIQLLTELGLEAITRNNFASYLRYHESIMEQSRLAYFSQ